MNLGDRKNRMEKIS